MIPFINLLPWRKQYRQRQLRYWSLLAAGCTLSVTLTGIAGPALLAWQGERQRIQAEYLSQLRVLLQRKLQQVQLLEKRQKLQEARKAQRLSVSEWEQRLTRLASLLPAGVWLTSLSMKSGQVVVHGNAEKPEEVRLMEQNLRRLAGIAEVAAKGIQRNANGSLVFTFTFVSAEAGHAD
ncbi:PilN domain-containing protein [Cedecea colo]|uniref:Fimbrial assembly protein (PilN) n=1 Tax=Cedecea colo TaxID=2552946 RepID=A0ABX0VR22_9ENTR|nr:PilN domain-containing protein [Cedecea colo]NIY49423.1 hypothetical protein [Cedecea colo]